MSKRDLIHICRNQGIKIEKDDTIAVLRNRIVFELAARRNNAIKTNQAWCRAIGETIDPMGAYPPLEDTQDARTRVNALCTELNNADKAKAAAVAQVEEKLLAWKLKLAEKILGGGTFATPQEACDAIDRVNARKARNPEVDEGVLPVLESMADAIEKVKGLRYRKSDYGEGPAHARTLASNLLKAVNKLLEERQAALAAIGSDDQKEELDVLVKAALGKTTETGRLAALPGYEKLAKTLDCMLEQAQSGKGAERHALPTGAASFEDQKIHKIPELQGHIGGLVYQLCKKALEAEHMVDPHQQAREGLGVGIYAAALVEKALERAAAWDLAQASIGAAHWRTAYDSVKYGLYMPTKPPEAK